MGSLRENFAALFAEDNSRVSTQFALAVACTALSFSAAISVYCFYALWLRLDLPPNLATVTNVFIGSGFGGAIAAVLGLMVIAPVLYVVNPYLNYFIPNLNIFQYLYANIVMLFLYSFLFGVVIGGFSSFIAVRRYLKN